jgi:hypothetical protein
VKRRIQWLIILQRFGSLATLIHKWTIAKTPKKNSHKDRIAINLIQRMTYLIPHQTETLKVLKLNSLRCLIAICFHLAHPFLEKLRIYLAEAKRAPLLYFGAVWQREYVGFQVSGSGHRISFNGSLLTP